MLLNPDQDFELSKDLKYLCSMLNCEEVVLHYDKKFNMWVTDYTILSDYEVKSWVKDNCLYLMPLKIEA